MLPGGALRPHEALLLVDAQRLRVHADELGGDADHVARAVVHRGRDAARASRPSVALENSRPSGSRRRLLELLERLALRLRQLRGHRHAHAREQVAAAVALEAAARRGPSRAAACRPASRPESSARRGRPASGSRPSAPSAASSRRDRHLEHEVVAAALVELRRLDARDDVEVAGRRAAPARLALALQLDLRAVLDAGRDPHRVALRAPLAAGAAGRSRTASRRRCRCRGSAGTAAAARTGPATSATTPLPLHSGQRFGAVPGAAPVPWQVWQASSSSTGTVASRPLQRVLERDAHVDLDVRPALAALRPRPASARGRRRRGRRRCRRGRGRRSRSSSARARAGRCARRTRSYCLRFSGSESTS